MSVIGDCERLNVHPEAHCRNSVVEPFIHSWQGLGPGVVHVNGGVMLITVCAKKCHAALMLSNPNIASRIPCARPQSPAFNKSSSMGSTVTTEIETKQWIIK